jgi:hypothetical protein
MTGSARLRSRLVPTLAVAALLLTASGCAASAPAASTSRPTPAATSSATTTPSPATPAPAATGAATAPPAPAEAAVPDADPAAPDPAAPDAGSAPAEPAYLPGDPSTWPITFEGVGPIVLGAPLAEVQAAIPLPSEGCEAPNITYLLPNTTIAARADGAGGTTVSTIFVGGQWVTPRTAEGISTGSLITELLAAYPGIPEHTDGAHRFYFLTDGTTYINFFVGGSATVLGVYLSHTELPVVNVC